MTNQEAIDILTAYSWSETEDENVELCEALDIALSALKIQIPIETIRVSNDRTDGCPICKTEFYEKFNFCPTCGKKMDWSG